MFRIAEYAIAAVALIATPLLADRYENEVHANVEYLGGRVTVDHHFGAVQVRTITGRRVDVRGTVRASDPELGRQIRFSTSNSNSGVMIRTEYPEGMLHHCNCSFSLDLEIDIPQNAPLTLKNRFGSIDIAGLRAASEVIGGQGSISFRDSRGAQRIEANGVTGLVAPVPEDEVGAADHPRTRQRLCFGPGFDRIARDRVRQQLRPKRRGTRNQRKGFGRCRNRGEKLALRGSQWKANGSASLRCGRFQIDDQHADDRGDDQHDQ